MIYRKIRYIIALLLIPFGAGCISAQSISAPQILQKAASALNSVGGVTAGYIFKSGSYSEKGTIAVKAHKYLINTAERTVWYDGKTMWSLNKDDKEVSISAPTAAEAGAMNPYLIAANYKTEYTAKLLKSTVKGTYNIQLTPKNKNSYLKSAILCVRASNYMPVRLDITDKQGNKTSIAVTDVKTNVSLPDSKFVYAPSANPGVKVIDLR